MSVVVTRFLQPDWALVFLEIAEVHYFKLIPVKAGSDLPSTMQAIMAFLSEVDCGSREENTSKQRGRASALIHSGPLAAAVWWIRSSLGCLQRVRLENF
jgi:hypothetical protein